jgi:hypothetical protein
MQSFEKLLFTAHLGCHHVDSEDARLRANASHQGLPKCPVIQRGLERRLLINSKDTYYSCRLHQPECLTLHLFRIRVFTLLAQHGLH